MKFSSPLEGQGTAQLSYAVEQNRSTDARTLQLSAGDQKVVVTQKEAGCGWKLSPAAITVGPAGGDATASLTVEDYCSWTIASASPWIELTSSPSGTGPEDVSLSIPANSGARRTATVEIKSKNVTVASVSVTQDPASAAPTPTPPLPPPATCTFDVSPQGIAGAPATATQLTVEVKTDSKCGWTAATSTAWITVSPSSSTGNGQVKLSLTANSGARRTGTVTVAGRTVTVVQNSPPCTYTVSPASFSLTSSAQAAEITVTTQSFCAVNATTNGGWIHIGSFAATGGGKIPLTIDRNGGDKSRSANVTITGDNNFSRNVKIDQAGR